ncbi:MAG: hypothetical protein ACK5KT_04795 [Dysgonomonas sp.]
MEEIRTTPNLEEQINIGPSQLLYEPTKEHEPLLARIISIVLHPFFMGIYGVALLFYYTDFNMIFSGQFLRFISPVFFLSCVVPISSIYFLKKAGLIGDYYSSQRNDRLIPSLLTLFSYSLLIYYFYTAKLFVWFLAVLAAPLLLTVIAAIVNIYWNISVHMMGIGGLIGCTLSICYNIKGLNPFVLFIILFILAGCLGVSRLILKRHTSAQVYIGFLVGLVISYLCVWIGTYWGFILLLKKL